MRKLPALFLLLAALTACDRGYPTESSQFATGSTPSLQSVSSVDAAYAQDLLLQDTEAVALASTALDPNRSASPRVQQLAQEIATGGNQQIGEISRLLRQWQVPSPAPATSSPVQSLVGLSGTQFDNAWLAAMVAHHQESIAAAVEAQKSDNPQVKDLAVATARTQNAQVAVMQDLMS